MRGERERALRHERLLHAPRDLQIARHLLVHPPELVLIRLHAQQRAQPGHDDLDVRALGDEVVRAGAEPLDDVLGGVGAGEHQHGDGLQLADRP